MSQKGLAILIVIALAAIYTGCGEEKGQISGLVTDSSAKLPLGGATVSLSSGETVITGENGRYLIVNLAEGTYLLTVYKKGYLVFSSSVTIEKGDNFKDVSLNPADSNAPVISNIQVILVDETTVKIIWATDEPATSLVEYGITPNYGQIISLPDLTTSHEALLKNLKPKTIYHYRVSGSDAQRNGPETSADDRNPTIDATFTTYVDTSRPDTFIISSPKKFTSSDTVIFSWEGADDETPKSELLYSYYLSGYDNNYSLFVAVTQKSYTELPDGKYTFYVRSKDASGNEDDSPAAFSFTVDTFSPTDPSIIINVPTSVESPSIGNGQQFTCFSAVRLTLSAKDATSKVAEMWVSNSPDFSTGRWEPFLENRSWVLSEGDGMKMVFVKFKDQAENISTTASDTIILDTTPPTQPVVEDGEFAAQELHADWSASDEESGIVEYRYAIGTFSKGTDVVNWMSVGTSTSVTRGDLNLRSNIVYYFSVQAKNGATIWSDVGISNGVKVLLSTIRTLKVTLSDPDPVKVTEDFTIKIQFSNSIDPTVLPKVELQNADGVLLVTQESGVFSQTSKPNDTYTTYPIKLNRSMEGKVTILISDARDLEGNIVPTDSKHSFLLDATPPTTKDDVPDRWVNHDVKVTLFEEDALSGIAKTYYTVDGSFPNPNSSVYSEPILFSAPEEHILKYYSEDVAGNRQEIHTVVIRIDKKAPPPVRNLTNTETSWGKDEAPAVTWDDVPDDLSGVSHYSGQVNKDEVISPIHSGWQPKVPSGISVIRVWAVDKAGNEDMPNATTTTVMYDGTPPGQIEKLTSSAAQWTSEPSPTLEWEKVFDAESSLASYEITIDALLNNQPDGSWHKLSADVRTWQATPPLSDGEYEAWIVAVDKVGNRSKPQLTLLRIDTSPPDEVTGVIDEGKFSSDTRLMFRWNPLKDISGIKSYIVHLSDTEDFHDIISEKTVDGNAVQVWFTESDGVAADENYYVRVKARNGAGLESAEWSEITDGITVDLTKPSAPVISVQPNPTSSRKVSLTVEAEDAVEMFLKGDLVEKEQWMPFQKTMSVTLAGGDGEKRISVIIKNMGGDETEPAETTVFLDTSPPSKPVITSTTHAMDVWTKDNNPVFSWNGAVDMHSGVVGYSYLFDNRPDTVPPDEIKLEKTTLSLSDVSDGIWYFHLKARNDVGLWSPIVHYQVKIDRTPPTIKFIFPTGGQMYNTRVTQYYGNAIDNTSGVDFETLEYNFNNTGWKSFHDDGKKDGWDDSDEIPHIKSGKAEVTLALRLKDKAGNSAVEQISFSVEVVVPPVSVFAVGGVVYKSDGVTPAPDGLTVKVSNLNTGKTKTALTGGKFGAGRYTVTFIDFSNNRAAKEGDVLEITTMDEDKVIADVIKYTLTADDILAGQVIINITTKM